MDTLNLAHNSLTALPISFVQFQMLRVLDLSHNKFTVFPSEVCSLVKLDALTLNDNFIEVLPDGVRQLQAVELELNNNRVPLIECFTFFSKFNVFI